MHRVLLATHNKGKLSEFSKLLLGIELISLDAVGITELPPEKGSTFAQNARIKAWSAASHCGMLTIADDSGLEVDALDGAPGVYSARYGGEGLNDNDRNEKLLNEISEVPDDLRTARFVCAIAVVYQTKTTALDSLVFRGVCEGSIARQPIGENGFGYDPIFSLSDGRTMAQLEIEEKNRISHRAKALEKFLKWARVYFETKNGCI